MTDYAERWDRQMRCLADRAARGEYRPPVTSDPVLHCQDPAHALWPDECPTCSQEET